MHAVEMRGSDGAVAVGVHQVLVGADGGAGGEGSGITEQAAMLQRRHSGTPSRWQQRLSAHGQRRQKREEEERDTHVLEFVCFVDEGFE
jgi:hypothetical protein